MFTKNHTVLAITVCGGMVFGATAAQASDFDRRYLAVDQTLHGNLSNAQMVMGQATNNQELFKLDASWETANDLRLGYIGSVVKGHDEMYRMYYEVRNIPGVGKATAVAESTDGLTWTKPALNIAPGYINHTDSNLVNLSGANGVKASGEYENGVVFYRAANPEAFRYVMHWLGDGGAYISGSSDGINFTSHLHQSGAAWSHKRDTGHSFFYDEVQGEWRTYGRKRDDWTSGIAPYNRRGVPLHSNTALSGSWSNVGQPVMDPVDYWDYSDGYNASDPTQSTGIRPDIYTPGVQPYHGQYIGLPSVFHRDADRDIPTRPAATYWQGTGPIYPMVAHSHDGINWVFPDPQSPDHPEHPIVDLTPHLRVSQSSASTSNAFEVGQMYSAGNFIEKDGQLFVYYHHRWATHYEGDASVYPASGNSVNVAVMRADGFASIKTAEGQSGEWRTTTVEVPNAAKGLLVNAKVEEGGSLRVEVLDTEGQVIGNLSLANSIAFQGDETSAFMNWSAGQFQEAAGQEVQLRFVVEDGEIYSFAWSPIPEPASLALLGLGGVMLLRRRR